MDKQDLIIIRNRICENVSHLEAQKKRMDGIISRIRMTDPQGQRMAKIQEKLDSINEKLAKSQSDLKDFKANPQPFLVALRNEREKNSRAYYANEKQKNVAKAHQRMADQKKKDATYKGCRQERRAHNWDKKKYRIYLNKFYKAVDSVPDYMKGNLKNMNNNKAYKWRGVCFYGQKPPVKDEADICFDRSRRGTQLIHMYESNDSKTWKYTCKEKGKDKQTRIIEEKIKPKTFGDLTEFPPPGAVPIKYGRPCRSNRDNRSGNRDNRSGSRKGGNRKGGKKKGKKSSGWKDSRPKNEQEPKRTSSKRRKK